MPRLERVSPNYTLRLILVRLNCVMLFFPINILRIGCKKMIRNFECKLFIFIKLFENAQ